MSAAILHTTKVSVGANGTTVEVVATIVEGDVEPGSNLKIEFNRSLSLEIPIAQVIELRNAQVRLILNCEDEEDALFVEALNFADDLVLVE